MQPASDISENEYLVEDATAVVVGNDGEAVLRSVQLMMKLLVKVATLLLCTNDVHQLPTHVSQHATDAALQLQQQQQPV